MKHLLILLIAPFFLLAQESTENADYQNLSAKNAVVISADGEGWLTNYDKALADAQKEDRNILVYFTGSDWCPPCKMLKTDLFDTQAFKTLASNYTLLYIDMPRNRELLSKEQLAHNSELLNKKNKKGVFPLLVILDQKGTTKDLFSGYSMDGKVQSHMDLLEKYKS